MVNDDGNRESSGLAGEESSTEGEKGGGEEVVRMIGPLYHMMRTDESRELRLRRDCPLQSNPMPRRPIPDIVRARSLKPKHFVSVRVAIFFRWGMRFVGFAVGARISRKETLAPNAIGRSKPPAPLPFND